MMYLSICAGSTYSQYYDETLSHFLVNMWLGG